LCLVVNWAAGLAQEELHIQEIMSHLNEGMIKVKQVLSAMLKHHVP
jgi:purine nucleoside phosphorylase